MSLNYFYDLGLSVIPCQGKRPIVEGWQKFNKCLPDDEQIEEWDTKYPTANVGLCVGPASGIIALDVDVSDEKIHKELAPHTTLRRHGRPGRMMYFYRWNGEEGKRVLGGVEIYYSTGQVIIDGVHPDTNLPYRLLVPEGLSLQEAIEMLPEFPPSAEAAIKAYLDAIPKEEKERRLGTGNMGVGRNASLASMAYHEVCYMLCTVPPKSDHQIAKELLESEWGSWFSDKSEPHGGQSPRAEAMKMVKRAIAKATDNGHLIDPTGFEAALAELELEEKMKEEKVEPIFEDHKNTAKYKHKVAEENRKRNHEAYLRAKAPPIPEKGLIRDIVDLSRTYYTEAPGIALAGALMVMSTLATKRFFSGGVSAAEFYFVIADTGAGKSFAHDWIVSKLIRDIKELDNGVEFGKPVSLPAIYMQLKENRYLGYVLKEAEGFLSSMTSGSKKAANVGDINEAVLQLWDNNWLDKSIFSTNVSKAAMSKGGGGVGRIAYPFMNLLCFTTIHQFKEMANANALRSGIFSRFMIFPQAYTKSNENQIVDDAAWSSVQSRIKTLSEKNNPTPMFDEDQVEEFLLDKQIDMPMEIPLWDVPGFRKMTDSNCDEIACIAQEDPRRGLANRFAQHVHKLALLYCVSELDWAVDSDGKVHDRNGFKFKRAKDLKIMPHHVEWGRCLFFWMLDEVEETFEEIEFSAEKNAPYLSNDKALSALKHIKKVKKISWRDLANKRHIGIKQQQDFFKFIGDYGVEVIPDKHPKNGKPTYTLVYKGE